MKSTTEQVVVPTNDLVPWLNLAVAIVLLNAGNLLLDAVAKSLGVSLELFLSPRLILSIGCLGLAFFFYVRSLARLPLAVAYPIMVGVSMIVVAVANHFWGIAELSQIQISGVMVLFFGVVMISTASRPS